MRICKIYDDHYPWDVRVEKVGRALIDAGHQVCLVTRNRNRAARCEVVDGMNVWRMPPIRLLPERLDVQLMFPAFFSPRWISHIASVASRSRSRAILVRDLPLAPTAIGVARALDLPVVLDMAENYPAALRAIHSHKTPTLGDHLARNPTLAQLVEDLCLPLLDHVFVVCEENRQRLLDKGVAPSRVSIVGNTPDLSVFTVDDEVAAEARDRFSGDFVLIYVGAVDQFRGLETVVDALPMIAEEIPNVRLAILGKGTGQSEVEARARRLEVRDRVDFVGFRPLTDLPGFIQSADICVIPHHRNDHIDTTLPNKLFDAMALGRPVVTTDAEPLTRIVEGEGCGRVYRSGVAEALAQQILELRDDSLRTSMGARGADAVKRRYNWAYDAAEIARVFEALDGQS